MAPLTANILAIFIMRVPGDIEEEKKCLFDQKVKKTSLFVWVKNSILFSFSPFNMFVGKLQPPEKNI